MTGRGAASLGRFQVIGWTDLGASLSLYSSVVEYRSYLNFLMAEQSEYGVI